MTITKPPVFNASQNFLSFMTFTITRDRRKPTPQNPGSASTGVIRTCPADVYFSRRGFGGFRLQRDKGSCQVWVFSEKEIMRVIGIAVKTG